MLIVYDSLTGNVERFVKKIPSRSVKITNGLRVNEPFILVTYTIGFGGVPESTASFVEENYSYLQAVVSSGNKVWGSNFARAGDTISDQYLVPLLLKFELSGTNKDLEIFTREVAILDERTNSKMVEAK
ncbi:class Ib ribonucleoside-diphosphate reductase assembly flavoprotein NrdI [Bacillus massiliigorillae]|uniref:class Ib ribonucleoside-diphosphate reductase assembly flavoprotein NrdI n=1 Tax=Bacillus massiliigorillae TaxID=1243664 RepID=UPI00039BFD52|nr:class Ib ribonucleoside-diphosphate reductase assembly flavoprotein NrdI [Bacillus massiliigorillae]